MLQAILTCLYQLGMFIFPCLLILIPLRFLTRIPDFVFRKLLHIVAFTGAALMLIKAPNWYEPAITSALIAFGLYPVLTILERVSFYKKFFVEKTDGEIKRSLVMYFLMIAALCTADGVLKTELSPDAVIMWGTGDAAAALVGIPFGRHRNIPRTDGKKSVEGTAAMFIVSAICGTAVMAYRMQQFDMGMLLIIVPCAAVGAAVELWSPSEYETVTVPAAIYICELLLGAILSAVLMVE